MKIILLLLGVWLLAAAAFCQQTSPSVANPQSTDNSKPSNNVLGGSFIPFSPSNLVINSPLSSIPSSGFNFDGFNQNFQNFVNSPFSNDFFKGLQNAKQNPASATSTPNPSNNQNSNPTANTFPSFAPPSLMNNQLPAFNFPTFNPQNAPINNFGFGFNPYTNMMGNPYNPFNNYYQPNSYSGTQAIPGGYQTTSYVNNPISFSSHK